MSLLSPCAPWRRPGLILLIALLMLAGCAPLGYRLDRSHPARSQDDRVTLLVLHYTADD